MTQWRVKTSKVLNLKYVVPFKTQVTEDLKKNSLLVLRKENIHSVYNFEQMFTFSIYFSYLSERKAENDNLSATFGF